MCLIINLSHSKCHHNKSSNCPEMSSQWILFTKSSRAHSLLYLVIILLPSANPVNLSNFHGLTELLSASSILFHIIRHDDVTSAPGYLQLGVDRLFARSFSSKRPPLESSRIVLSFSLIPNSIFQSAIGGNPHSS